MSKINSISYTYRLTVFCRMKLSQSQSQFESSNAFVVWLKPSVIDANVFRKIGQLLEKLRGCIGCQYWPNYQKYCKSIFRLKKDEIMLDWDWTTTLVISWFESLSRFFFFRFQQICCLNVWMNFSSPTSQWNPSWCFEWMGLFEVAVMGLLEVAGGKQTISHSSTTNLLNG